jgi:hypothetical protein
MAQWLSDHSFDFAGCLRVYAVGEDGVTAFTDQASNASSKLLPTRGLPEERRIQSNRVNSAAAVFTAC